MILLLLAQGWRSRGAKAKAPHFSAIYGFLNCFVPFLLFCSFIPPLSNTLRHPCSHTLIFYKNNFIRTVRLRFRGKDKRSILQNNRKLLKFTGSYKKKTCIYITVHLLLICMTLGNVLSRK